MVGVLTEYWNYRGDLERVRSLLNLPQRMEAPAASPVRRQRRLDREQVAQMAAERRAGAEIDDLAESFGVHRATVINHLHRAGVEGHRYTGRTLSPVQIHDAGELYGSGLSLVEVGAEFDVDRRYLRRVLPAAGFRLRPAGRQARGWK
jgi:hypothetical protein